MSVKKGVVLWVNVKGGKREFSGGPPIYYRGKPTPGEYGERSRDQTKELIVPIKASTMGKRNTPGKLGGG